MRDSVLCSLLQTLVDFYCLGVNLELAIHQVVRLLAYISDKDLFAEFYR